MDNSVSAVTSAENVLLIRILAFWGLSEIGYGLNEQLRVAGSSHELLLVFSGPVIRTHAQCHDVTAGGLPHHFAVLDLRTQSEEQPCGKVV